MKKKANKLRLCSLLPIGILGSLFFLGLVNTSNIHAQTAQHKHFDMEREKSGVVFSRSYRTQAEVDMDWFIHGFIIPAGHADAGYYEPSLDGAKMPIKYQVPTGQLRNNNQFAGISGDIWVEFEIYIPQGFYDTDFGVWDSMKIFRVYGDKTGCIDRNEKLMTPTWVDNDSDTIWFRGGCGMGDFKTGYKVPADRWTRILMNINMIDKRFEVWATDVELDTTKTIFSIEVPEMATTNVVKAAPMLHSTSRDHHGDEGPPHPDFFIGYRNLIVRSTGESPPVAPDTTAPARPTGLNVQ